MSCVKIGNLLLRVIEPDNMYNNAIVAKWSNEIGWHVPEALAKRIFKYMEKEKIVAMGLIYGVLRYSNLILFSLF